MIAKSFLYAKSFRADGTKSLQQEKSIRDYSDELGKTM